MADVTDDRTKTLTEADIDPIGSAAKGAPAWVDQGKAAKDRKTELTWEATEAARRDYDIRANALHAAIQLEIAFVAAQGSYDAAAVARNAEVFVKMLKGESDADPA